MVLIYSLPSPVPLQDMVSTLKPNPGEACLGVWGNILFLVWHDSHRFLPNSDSESVKHHRAAPMKKHVSSVHLSNHLLKINTIASIVKGRFSSLDGVKIHKYVSFRTRIYVLIKVVTPKRLGNPQVDLQPILAIELYFDIPFTTIAA
ncbi:hypothetical protein TNCV_1278411 [Trichonephila clavipes]|nr:hypothetical protein TNCV_1278411 [Trichonephila clavipes]